MILKDTIAQTFILKENKFISELWIYFSKYDTTDTVTVEIRDTNNGFPGEIIYGTVQLLNSDIQTSTNGTIPTKIKFKQLINIEKDKFYSFVISGFSKNTRLWLSRIGNNILETNKTLEVQPSKGSMFTSQNGVTWTIQQTDDLKYDIYTAKFKTTTGTLALKSKERPYISLCEFPFEAEAGSSLIRIFCKNHGLNPLDKVKLKMFTSISKIKFTITGNGLLYPGHIITTATGTARVTNVSYCSLCTTNNTYDVYFELLTGHFEGGQSFTSDTFTEKGNTFYITIEDKLRSAVNGTVVDTFQINLNGIPNDYFLPADGLVVQTVDSIDSFIVDVGINASISGRFGPSDAEILCNYKFDVFNVQGNQALFGSNCNWFLSGKLHGQKGGPLESNHKVSFNDKPVILNNDMYLEEPMNHFSNLNYSGSSITTKAEFDSGSIYNTPVFDLNSFGTILISNQVSLPFLNMDTAPNSSGRNVLETDPINGTNAYKYVSKTVNLRNPALDIRVLVDVYQDITADFKFYIKKINSADTRRIDEIDWTEISGFTKPKSDSKYLSDKIEIDFVTSDSNIVGWDGLSFSTFKFKIVGTATNSCKAPLFSNLRVIALT